MVRLKKLTRARFEQWLREHPTEMFVTCADTRCPLAVYLRNVYGGKALHSVGTTSGVALYDDRPNVEFYVPVWATQFIKAIDGGGLRGINGAVALQVITTM